MKSTEELDQLELDARYLFMRVMKFKRAHPEVCEDLPDGKWLSWMERQINFVREEITLYGT